MLVKSVPSFIIFLCIVYGSMSQAIDTLSLTEAKRLSMEELLNIEVMSVSRRSEKVTETPSAIQVIDQEAIRYAGVSSVPEALRLASNLQVAQVNSSQWAISARGFNNVLANKLLVLIDGRVVYTPMYAGVFWDVQNLVLEDIERIEVISGPGATLWGANAVNGVINIITKSSKDTQGLFAEAGGGTELRGLGSVRYGDNVNDNLHYRVYATAFKRDNTIFMDSVDAYDDWHMIQGGLRVDWTPDKENHLSFQANLYDGRPQPNEEDSDAIVARGKNVVSHWTKNLSEQSILNVQLFYDETWRDFRNGFTEKLRTYDVEAQHNFELGSRHQIIYGAGFRFMDHNVNNLENFGFFPGRKSLYISNIFLQDDIALIEEILQLTVGTKVEDNTYTGIQHQPNLRISWTPQPHKTVWAAVSRAVRNPARIDREFAIYLTPDIPIITGSDNFQSEEVLAYELGGRIQAKDKLTISLATFYNTYDNIRSAEPGPIPPFNIPTTFANGVEGNSYGAELSATYQPRDWWRIRAGYTFLEKDLTIKPTSSDLNNGTAESNDPNHQALIQSMMNFSDRFELGVFLRYIDELPTPPVDSYVGLDIRLAFDISKHIQLSVVGQNLIQEYHTEFIPTSPAPKSIERGVYGKVVCRF